MPAVEPVYRTIHDLPAGMRPRERLAYAGPAALSDSELLAIILRGGVRGTNVLDLATQVLHQFGGLSGLAQLSVTELQEVHGMGEAKAAQVLAAIELGRRVIKAQWTERQRATSPAEVADLLMTEMAYADQEFVKVVLLDSRNYVLAIPTVYKGSLNSAHVRMGELFKEAIRRNAAAIIVAHNHPSGDPTPSPEDIRFTAQLVKAARVLDMTVLDHVVIGHQRYISLKEQGVAFT